MARKSFKTAALSQQDDLNAQLFREAEGDTPDLQKMASLIKAGADPNARNKMKRTVLMMAVSKQNKDAAEVLIDNGADMYARDAGTPVADAIFYALANYDRDMVAMFLDKGFDPNRGPCRGNMTPLMWAANFHKLELCEELATRGADINAKNPDNGWTATKYAEDNLKYHIAERLREIDTDNKARAKQKEIEERTRAEQARLAVEKAALEALCNQGLPTQGMVKLMQPITLKPRVKA